ncbi:AbiH family protein [Belliella pelovolcani]|uniref:Bacteriophage abortive infection AbiH n=1 Tax=Belliella pelovolcani TaxID=529505 RepID=A0A1N7NT07_9BACT|nr:AbiH family protein [Belliella pelovolcani]SIT01503.1 Bacteriophage abortive infection AbiH [Belliella pelovolcani]
MKILFVLGNGFDLSLGMKSKYSDFFSHFNCANHESVLIKDIKAKIKNDYENWADLELALGKYTEEINTIEEFDEVLDCFKDSLADYLKEEEEKLDFDSIDFSSLQNYLIYFERNLPPADKQIINTHKHKWASKEVSIEICTFNYTYILDRIFKDYEQNNFIGTHKNHSKYYLKGLTHIHGYYDKDMVLGVNDTSQIGNLNFRDDLDITDSLVKEQTNIANKYLIENQFKKQIINSNVIIIFGSSIGDTDKIWWERIGERLKGDCYLVIFTLGKEISPRHRQKMVRSERKMRKYFLDKTKLNEKEKSSISQKIIIRFNSDFLKFPLIVPTSE